jgi:hypothetical protein
MKVSHVHKEFLGGTQVTVHVPEFENFGKRLDELERQADEANPIDPAEVQASTAQLLAGVQELHEKALKKLESKPAGPKKAMDALMLGMLQGMAKGVSESAAEADTEEPEGDAQEVQPAKRDLQQLELLLPRGMKWSRETQAMVEQFFADWPRTRPVVLKATFDYYKKNYPEFVTLFAGHKGVKFILPEPNSPEVVADVFYIASIHWHRDGAIGLSGHCTWDEEHGYGLRLKDGKVTAVGPADEAFS